MEPEHADMSGFSVRHQSRAKLVTALCLVIPVVGLSLHFTLESPIDIAIMIIGYFGWLFLPQTITRLTNDKHLVNLDERELSFRIKAYSFSYQVMGAVTVGLIAVMYIATSVGDIANDFGTTVLHVNTSDVLALMMSTILVFWYTPLAYIAWKMPPPLDDLESE